MIDLEIRGGRKSERKLLEDAFWFALKTLMPRKRKLEIEIVLKNIPDAEGWHQAYDKYQHGIEIQKGQDVDNLLTTLFHEMVHVRQFERGEFMDEDNIPYWKKPSEKEAYKLQEEILEKWNQSMSSMAA